LNKVKERYPYFELKLIITGLKLVGQPHINKMIKSIIEGRGYSNLIAGFDMVNEEDVTPPILEFVNEIIEGKKKDSGFNMPCYFHCGETHDRCNENLYDAILLNSKRIGHGF
jgi:adenosine deaminase CECR1